MASFSRFYLIEEAIGRRTFLYDSLRSAEQFLGFYTTLIVVTMASELTLHLSHVMCCP